MTRRSRELGWPAAAAALAAALLLALAVGVSREWARRYPSSDLPRVDLGRIESQVRSGNLTRSEARFYRSIDAWSGSAQDR